MLCKQIDSMINNVIRDPKRYLNSDKNKLNIGYDYAKVCLTQLKRTRKIDKDTLLKMDRMRRYINIVDRIIKN